MPPPVHFPSLFRTILSPPDCIPATRLWILFIIQRCLVSIGFHYRGYSPLLFCCAIVAPSGALGERGREREEEGEQFSPGRERKYNSESIKSLPLQLHFHPPPPEPACGKGTTEWRALKTRMRIVNDRSVSEGIFLTMAMKTAFSVALARRFSINLFVISYPIITASARGMKKIHAAWRAIDVVLFV